MKNILAAALALVSSFAFADSIRDLPALSKLIVDHYECRVAIFQASGANKEMKFQISPNVSGHDSADFTIVLGADKVTATANAQALQVLWTRGTQGIANAQAWVQNSTTRSFVLIVTDPNVEDNQVHLNCDGITFADLKAAQNRGQK